MSGGVRARRDRSADRRAGDAQRSSRTDALYAALPSAEPSHRSELIEEVVLLHLPIADAIAARYAGRGVAAEDLVQVARLALVRAAHGFRPELATDFLSYAVPSVRGAVKRHFRDSAWTVRPPRRVQEAQLVLNAGRPALVQQLGREPTVAEAAAALGLDEETVLEAVTVDSCFSPDSLDRPVDTDGEGTLELIGCLGAEDPGYLLCDQRTMLSPLIEALPARDRLVLHLRFVQGLTQSEVGQHIGVTQMQVSRILSRLLGHLRDGLGEPTPRSAELGLSA